MGRPDALIQLGRLLAAAALLTGCAASPVGGPGVSGPPPVPSASADDDRGAVTRRAEVAEPAPGRAREGTSARSQVDRFTPVKLVLPGKATAEVVPVSTVDGVLQVPARVNRLGWWDGSAWLGDPFGATVIAGHVDSAAGGLGFFVQLLGVQVGERISVIGAKGQRQVYRVTSVRVVAKNALATDGAALDQTGDHRLELITCTGEYRPGRGYESNLVVTATRG